MSPKQTEAQFQDAVIDYARQCGWLTYHPYDSRRSTSGFPDLTMVRRGRIVFAELKTEVGKLRTDQRRWIDELGIVQGDARTAIMGLDESDIQSVRLAPIATGPRSAHPPVSELTDTYAEVQALKVEPWEPPEGSIEAISRAFTASMLREPTTAELLTMITGVGWIYRMALDEDLDMTEIVAVATESRTTPAPTSPASRVNLTPPTRSAPASAPGSSPASGSGYAPPRQRMTERRIAASVSTRVRAWMDASRIRPTDGPRRDRDGVIR